MECTSNTHGCRVEPLGVHIRHPRMSTRTAWSSHPTPTDVDSNRLEFTSDAHGCRLEPLGVHIRRPRMSSQIAWCTFSTHSTAIHGRMLHVSLDHDGAVMVLIAEAAKEEYDE